MPSCAYTDQAAARRAAIPGPTPARRPGMVASPLAKRPYDLRHPAVSLWLNAGVPAPEGAERAGHSVDVLLRVYAKCQIKPRANVRLTLTSDGLALDQLSDPLLTFRLPASGEAPFLRDWRNWIAQQVTKKPEPVTSARGVALNPAYLARFRAASRDHLPLEIRPAGRFMVITCGTHFLGLVTPMDLSKSSEYGSDPLAANWLSTLAKAT
ncbi:hypothetical protein GCM10022224_087330 [Nonomuraea antimicrobica]|uniref:Uncharacterized protein n=1 Tax=Nonomuraea antimicrobica TaxID=561173 RepID=A0ABP7DS39_9ACTN